MILDKAFHIVKENGIDAVTARSVAKALGCSIQPIFSQFSTMEDLKHETFEYACQNLMADILKFQDAPNFFSKASMWVIHLAREEKQLFHLLYLSNSYQSQNLLEVMLAYESNHKILKKMIEIYELDLETCSEILVKAFLFLHGTASMIYTNHIEFTDEQAARMIKQTVEDMVQGAKRRGESQ
jgi:AcrR family transcriptional regulator